MAEISEKVFLPQTENELFRASANIKHADAAAPEREIMRASYPFMKIALSPKFASRALMSLRQSPARAFAS
jgi:hypothetical protein